MKLLRVLCLFTMLALAGDVAAQCCCGAACPPGCTNCPCQGAQFTCNPPATIPGPAPVQPVPQPPPAAPQPMWQGQAPSYGYQFQQSYQFYGSRPMAYAPMYAPPATVTYGAAVYSLSARVRPWRVGRMARRAARRGATLTIVGGY